MKFIRIIFCFAIISLVCNACTTEKRRVERVAMGYLEATSAYDIDRACHYCTPETAEGLRIIQKRVLPQLDADYLKQNSQAEVKITGVELEGDSIANVAWWKKSPIDTFSDTLKLVKRDGQWLADVRFVIPEAILCE